MQRLTLKMKGRKGLIYVFFIMVLLANATHQLLAQQPNQTGGLRADSLSSMSGILRGKNGAGLPYATVLLLEKKKTVLSDVNGRFVFRNLPAGKYTVRGTMVGFNAHEVKVDFKGNDKPVIIELLPADSALNDVVVVGYQAIKRRAVTGAVSSIKGEEIQNMPVASLDQALQGRIAGLNVQNNTGEPGVAPAITIRGNSKVSYDYDELNATSVPLYIIDGVEQPQTSGGATGTNYLAMFDFNDIESIDVLKDASATAIYGSRGANGVIIITTKAAKSGELKVGVDSYFGYTEKPTLRKMAVGTTERDEKLTALQNIYANNLAAISDLPAVLTDSLNPQYNGAIDWQGLNYREGLIRNTGININGGSKNANYRISLGNYAEQGIIRSSDIQRYTLRASLNGSSTNGKFTFSPTVSLSYVSRGRGNGSTAYATSYKLALLDGSGSSSTLNYGSIPSSLYNLTPAAISTIIGSYPKSMDVNTDKNYTLNWQMGYKLSNNLQLTSRESYNGLISQRNQYRTSAMNGNSGTSAASLDYFIDRYSASNYATFNSDFKKSKHTLAIVAGTDILYTDSRTTSISATGGSNDQVQVINGYTSQNTTASTSHTVYSSISFYSRLLYSFNKKYYLTLSGRKDGSSRFGDNVRWAYFPSSSIGWIVSDENFFQKQNVLTYMKLRASYGTSGNEPSKNYLQYNTFNVGSANYASSTGVSTYNSVTAITPNFSSGASQPNLTWERTKEINLGLDFELFQGRVKSSIDLYDKEASSQFYYVKLPVTTGYSTATTNAAGTRNKGIDLSLTTINLPVKSTFQWRTTLNVTLNQNRLVSLPNSGRDIYFGNSVDFEQSHVNSRNSPINSFYLYQTKGVYSTDADVPVNPLTGSKQGVGTGTTSIPSNTYGAGDMAIVDQNGDYLINIYIGSGYNPDKIRTGNPNPKFTGGFINDFTYKGWSLSTVFTYVFGRDILNRALATQFYNIGDISSMARMGIEDLHGLGMFMKAGDKASFPKFDIVNRKYYFTPASTFFLEKGDFVRLKTVSLGYNFNGRSKLAKQLHLNGLRLYANIDNLWLWKDARRIPDPENVNAYGEYTGAGYAVPKKYTLGFNVNF